MNKISAIILARNEQDNILYCINSLMPVCDEVVLADTGSTDETKPMSLAAGARVVDIPWNNSFATARNLALKQAKYNTVIFLDADERLVIKNLQRFKDYLNNLKSACLIEMRHMLSSSHKSCFISFAVRAFNKKGNKYTGAVHERLKLNAHQMQNLYTQVCPYAYIEHYGYTTTNLQKSERNLQLLLKDTELKPWTKYHIAAELMRLGKLSDAMEYLSAAMLELLSDNKLPPPLFYRLKYQLYLKMGTLNQLAEAIDKACSLYPHYTDLHFLKGLALFKNKQYNEAEQAFCYCLMLNNNNPKFLYLYGTDNFLPYKYLREIYQVNQNTAAMQICDEVLDTYREQGEPVDEELI